MGILINKQHVDRLRESLRANKENDLQPLQVGKQILPHLGLHLHADDVAVILHKVAQQHPDDVQTQHDCTGDDDGGIHFLRDVDIQHLVGDHGVDHADDGDQKRRQQIQRQHLPVGSVVAYKSFQHLR